MDSPMSFRELARVLARPCIRSRSSVAASCTTASHDARPTAGRAHQSGEAAHANGPTRTWALGNLFVPTTLEQAGTHEYVIDTRP